MIDWQQQIRSAKQIAPVILFRCDDGNISDYDVVQPVCAALGIPGVSVPIMDWIGDPYALPSPYNFEATTPEGVTYHATDTEMRLESCESPIYIGTRVKIDAWEAVVTALTQVSSTVYDITFTPALDGDVEPSSTVTVNRRHLTEAEITELYQRGNWHFGIHYPASEYYVAYARTITGELPEGDDLATTLAAHQAALRALTGPEQGIYIAYHGHICSHEGLRVSRDLFKFGGLQNAAREFTAYIDNGAGYSETDTTIHLDWASTVDEKVYPGQKIEIEGTEYVVDSVYDRTGPASLRYDQTIVLSSGLVSDVDDDVACVVDKGQYGSNTAITEYSNRLGRGDTYGGAYRHTGVTLETLWSTSSPYYTLAACMNHLHYAAPFCIYAHDYPASQSNRFEATLGFLRDRGAIFVSPAEWYEWVVKKNNRLHQRLGVNVCVNGHLRWSDDANGKPWEYTAGEPNHGNYLYIGTGGGQDDPDTWDYYSSGGPASTLDDVECGYWRILPHATKVPILRFRTHLGCAGTYEIRAQVRKHADTETPTLRWCLSGETDAWVQTTKQVKGLTTTQLTIADDGEWHAYTEEVSITSSNVWLNMQLYCSAALDTGEYIDWSDIQIVRTA